MHELEKYECFGVPSHVWVEDDGRRRPQFTASTRRNWVLREAAMMLGAEATPSPPLEVETRK